jgi:hypothetical protein
VGAVPDADTVRVYLQKHLGVPSSQIRNLHNREATLAAIMEEIKSFSLNDEIKVGDPILNYYAGPDTLKVRSTGKIELLVPYDPFSPLENANLKHGSGGFLSHLAIEKGDNTVHQTFILRGFIYQLTT